MYIVTASINGRTEEFVPDGHQFGLFAVVKTTNNSSILGTGPSSPPITVVQSTQVGQQHNYVHLYTKQSESAKSTELQSTWILMT